MARMEAEDRRLECLRLAAQTTLGLLDAENTLHIARHFAAFVAAGSSHQGPIFGQRKNQTRGKARTRKAKRPRRR